MPVRRPRPPPRTAASQLPRAFHVQAHTSRALARLELQLLTARGPDRVLWSLVRRRRRKGSASARTQVPTQRQSIQRRKCRSAGKRALGAEFSPCVHLRARRRARSFNRRREVVHNPLRIVVHHRRTASRDGGTGGVCLVSARTATHRPKNNGARGDADEGRCGAPARGHRRESKSNAARNGVPAQRRRQRCTVSYVRTRAATPRRRPTSREAA